MENATEETIGNEATFRAAYDDKNIYIEINCKRDDTVLFCFEHKLMEPGCEILIDKDGKPYLPEDIDLYVPLYGDKFQNEYGKYDIVRTDSSIRIAANREKCGAVSCGIPFKLCIKVNDESWVKEDNPSYNLGRHLYSAGEFGWVVMK